MKKPLIRCSFIYCLSRIYKYILFFVVLIILIVSVNPLILSNNKRQTITLCQKTSIRLLSKKSSYQWLLSTTTDYACGFLADVSQNIKQAQTVVFYNFLSKEYKTYYLPDLNIWFSPTIFMLDNRIYVFNSTAESYAGVVMTYDDTTENKAFVINPFTDEIEIRIMDSSVMLEFSGSKIPYHKETNTVILKGVDKKTNNESYYEVDLSSFVCEEASRQFSFANSSHFGSGSGTIVPDYNFDGKYYYLISDVLSDRTNYCLLRGDLLYGFPKKVILNVFPFEGKWTIGVMPNVGIMDSYFFYQGSTNNEKSPSQPSSFIANLDTGLLCQIDSDRGCPIATYRNYFLFSSRYPIYNRRHILSPDETVLIDRDEYLTGSYTEVLFTRAQ